MIIRGKDEVNAANWFADYNAANGKNYQLAPPNYPSDKYVNGWANYPYDYWFLWVKNAGENPVGQEKTLELLTKEHNVIIWKHCFPVSTLYSNPNPEQISVESKEKTIENYKLQCNALKEKMLEFRNTTRFIVWTGAPQASLSDSQAKLTKEFFDWVRNGWDEEGDNIFVFDFYYWQTDQGKETRFPKKFAEKPDDPYESHPNAEFAKVVCPYFCQRVVDVIQNYGDTKSITGKEEE